MPRNIAYGAIAVATGLCLAGTVAAENAPAEVAYASDITFADDGSLAQPLTDTPGNAEEGARIYADKGSGNCVACHAITDRTDADFQGNIGPALDGAGDRWSVEQLRGIVADAKRTFPRSMMPSQYKTQGFIRPGDGFTGKAAKEPLPPLLTGQQIEDVVAYLTTLKE